MQVYVRQYVRVSGVELSGVAVAKAGQSDDGNITFRYVADINCTNEATVIRHILSHPNLERKDTSSITSSNRFVSGSIPVDTDVELMSALRSDRVSVSLYPLCYVHYDTMRFTCKFDMKIMLEIYNIDDTDKIYSFNIVECTVSDGTFKEDFQFTYQSLNETNGSDAEKSKLLFLHALQSADHAEF